MEVFINFLLSENCVNKLNCKNEGFQDQNCKCYCPSGFTGTLCETIITSSLSKYLNVEFFVKIFNKKVN